MKRQSHIKIMSCRHAVVPLAFVLSLKRFAKNSRSSFCHIACCPFGKKPLHCYKCKDRMSFPIILGSRQIFKKNIHMDNSSIMNHSQLHPVRPLSLPPATPPPTPPSRDNLFILCKVHIQTPPQACNYNHTSTCS